MSKVLVQDLDMDGSYGIYNCPVMEDGRIATPNGPKIAIRRSTYDSHKPLVINSMDQLKTMRTPSIAYGSSNRHFLSFKGSWLAVMHKPPSEVEARKMLEGYNKQSMISVMTGALKDGRDDYDQQQLMTFGTYALISLFILSILVALAIAYFSS